VIERERETGEKGVENKGERDGRKREGGKGQWR
jgi:hypothetical protein